MPDKSTAEFLKSIELASKALLMYPENHPRTQQAIQLTYQLVSQATANRDGVTISIAEENLLVDGELVERGNPVIEKLYRELLSRSIHSLTFNRGISLEELLVLLRHLNLKPARIQEMGGFERVLQNEGVKNVQVNKVKYGIISEDGGGAVDQSLLSELLFAVQTIVSGASDSNLAAQNLEKSLDTSHAPDPAGLLMRVFQTIAQKNPAQAEETPQQESLKERFVDLYRSFTPAMQAKLLLTAVVKEGQEEAALGGFHRELTPQELEASILAVLDQPIQESELQDFVSRLQKEEGVVLSDAVKTRMEEKGLVEKKVSIPPPLWEELLIKETLSPEEIASSGEALTELLQAQNLNDADRLSKKIFSYLSAGRPDQKIASIQAIPAIISTLSQNEKWKNLEFSLSFLISTCFRKETDDGVSKALLSYLLASFRKLYEAKNFQGCQEVLGTVRSQVEKNDALRKEFAEQASSFAAILLEDLLAAPGSAEAAFDCLKLMGPIGAQLLLDQLSGEEEQARRLRLINNIISLNPDVALAAMEKRVSDSRWYVVRNLATLLGKMNLRETPAAFHQLASHPDARVAKELIKNLFKSFSKKDEPLIVQLLQHPDKAVRLQAVHLAAINSLESAASHLLRLAGSVTPADTDLRAACLQALLKLKVAEAVTPALASLERRTGSRAELAERNAAVKILGELSRAQTLPILQRIASSDPNPETRALATTYL